MPDGFVRWDWEGRLSQSHRLRRKSALGAQSPPPWLSPAARLRGQILNAFGTNQPGVGKDQKRHRCPNNREHLMISNFRTAAQVKSFHGEKSDYSEKQYGQDISSPWQSIPDCSQQEDRADGLPEHQADHDGPWIVLAESKPK